ncbi:hypothetical protein [Pontibacter mangrovi]|uniref:Uncharacterized protein n=1 Tax=Pontibacter mangrovi TaxID=2589816 RepID=A0A501W0M8_9BACT|nr:hypothetical protein [Pontibacter mangrovi]TPE43199.1 hypothetical protein FJM65_13870 [Pontibacter mangrovi]
MKENSKSRPSGKKHHELKESIEKKGAGQANGYITGGPHPDTRPEQGPDVPPQERTEGIP